MALDIAHSQANAAEIKQNKYYQVLISNKSSYNKDRVFLMQARATKGRTRWSSNQSWTLWWGQWPCKDHWHDRFDTMQWSYYACHCKKEICLHLRIVCSGTPRNSTLNRMDKIFISENRSSYSVSCTAITRSSSFRSGTANSIWDCPFLEKKKIWHTVLSYCHAIFVVVLVCISLLFSQVLRGYSYFPIVLFLINGCVSLDCNIKCMHLTF